MKPMLQTLYKIKYMYMQIKRHKNQNKRRSVKLSYPIKKMKHFSITSAVRKIGETIILMKRMGVWKQKRPQT